MGRMLRVVVAVSSLVFLVSRVSTAETVKFDFDVNQWSSSSPPPSTGVYPIGGSGQVNGGFVVGTDPTSLDQIGLRAELRNVGPVLSQTNDSIHTATYIAPAGSSGGNRALWNFDFDIDLAGGHKISDYTAILKITDGATVTSLNLVTSGLVPSDATLYQNSENAGFAFLATEFPGFNPNAAQDYSFDLSLTPNGSNPNFVGGALDVAMDVDVVAPLPAVLPVAGLALVGFIAFSLLRKRKLAL